MADEWTWGFTDDARSDFEALGPDDREQSEGRA